MSLLRMRDSRGTYVPIYVPFRDWDPLRGEGHMSLCSAGRGTYVPLQEQVGGIGGDKI